jgi:hypothetical protein
MIEAVTKEYRNFRVVATTLRTVRTATVNDWGAIAWAEGRFVEATHRAGLEIMDRVEAGRAIVERPAPWWRALLTRVGIRLGRWRLVVAARRVVHPRLNERRVPPAGTAGSVSTAAVDRPGRSRR